MLAAALLAELTFAAGATAYAQRPTDLAGRNCSDVGCHDTYAGKPVVHSPVGSGDCDGCHELADEKAHRFKFVAEPETLCYECHDEFEGKSVHQPVGDGNCVACHDPHASATPKLLNAATEALVCAECHDHVTDDRAFPHGPVAAGACSVCHNPHVSDHATLLVAPERDTCLKCHADMAARLAGGGQTHAPVAEGCVACHDPHGGDNRMVLKTVAPKLCLECHDDIGDIIDEAVVGHSPVTSGTSCANCHDSHASRHDDLLAREQMDLCMSCHDQAQGKEGAKVAGLGALLAEHPDHHGPIRQKNCAGCHKVHGGEHFRMLNESYPAEFYASYEESHYALCFQCHEADAMSESETDTSTAFRNGKQNLHFVHVNRDRKGRTCRACHETHASKRPKHLAESTPFGAWRIPVGFTALPNGGSCASGCHRPYRYDRENAVANLPG
jgi:predicted CXXCH cytochrome family protein